MKQSGKTAAPVSAAADLEQRTQVIGRDIFDHMRCYHPSPGETLEDRAMLLLARAPRFRAHLLRFIDALAGLDGDRTGVRIQRLLHEYLDTSFPHLPAWLQALVPLAASEVWPPSLVAAVARLGATSVASRFIAAGGPQGALPALTYLRAQRRFPSFDVLGEYVASEVEADAYRDQYLRLLQTLGRTAEAGSRTAGGVCALQVSVKLSSLTSDFNPVDPDGTLARVRPRLLQIAGAARAAGIGIALDMERFETRDLTLAIFFELFQRGSPHGDWDGVGVVLQAYLRDAGEQARQLRAFADARGTPFQIRLVKGAYWDYETVVAHENGWPVPVWEQKWQTDQTYERIAAELIAAYPRVLVAIASHNIRSHAHAEAVRESLGLAPGVVEHQTLFRTAEGVARALASMGWSARDYVPLGELLPGMAYLVRRILENSSQAGFLLHSRAGDSADHLLAPPQADTIPIPQESDESRIAAHAAE